MTRRSFLCYLNKKKKIIKVIFPQATLTVRNMMRDAYKSVRDRAQGSGWMLLEIQVTTNLNKLIASLSKIS